MRLAVEVSRFSYCNWILVIAPVFWMRHLKGELWGFAIVCLLDNKFAVSMEKALSIVYQPQAVFRIRPVNCCSVTISGMIFCILFALPFHMDTLTTRRHELFYLFYIIGCFVILYYEWTTASFHWSRDHHWATYLLFHCSSFVIFVFVVWSLPVILNRNTFQRIACLDNFCYW